jgi:hypothetical protein
VGDVPLAQLQLSPAARQTTRTHTAAIDSNPGRSPACLRCVRHYQCASPSQKSNSSTEEDRRLWPRIHDQATKIAKENRNGT